MLRDQCKWHWLNAHYNTKMDFYSDEKRDISHINIYFFAACDVPPYRHPYWFFASMFFNLLKMKRMLPFLSHPRSVYVYVKYCVHKVGVQLFLYTISHSHIRWWWWLLVSVQKLNIKEEENDGNSDLNTR